MKLFKPRQIVISILAVLFCFTFACVGNETKAREVYELAMFEEKQFNATHAIQLYDQILKDYPKTESAVKARNALTRLKSVVPDK